METCELGPIRPQMDHVSALRSVEHLSLGDSDYTEAEILSVLRRPEHMAIGAWKDAILVGFCSCLVTATAAGLRLARTEPVRPGTSR